MSAFEITLPAVRGVQAGRDYYLSAIPFRHVPQIFGTGSDDPVTESPPGNSRKTVRELARYLLDNPAQFTLPPLVACIDGKIDFLGSGAAVNVGAVRIGMDARISVNDGRHSIAAITTALATNPALGDQTVSVVFIPDAGLKRCRQIFADLARNSIRNSSSLTLLYDQRGEAAQLAKGVMRTVPLFAELTETKKSSISNRSTKLFTLSAIHSATQTLLAGLDAATLKQKVQLSASFGPRSVNRSPPGSLPKRAKFRPPN